MRSTQKKILRAIGDVPIPRVTQQQYDEFFRHPCWLALRQQAAIQLDSAADREFSSLDMNDICMMRGVMQGLLFVLQAQANLMHIIAENEGSSRTTERRLEELLKLWETEDAGCTDE